MRTSHTWRTFLGQLIEDPYVRRRLADSVGVSPITLIRWTKGGFNPRVQSLRRLVQALDKQQQERLLPLIEQVYPDVAHSLSDVPHEPASLAIPPSLYARTLYTVARAPAHMLFFSLCDFILGHALKQLDPDRLGMSLVVARCLPPTADGMVRSLLESEGRGTSPWPTSTQQGALLGVESLVGSAVTTQRVQANQHLGDASMISPGYQDRNEKSAVAAPILYTGQVAGALLASSTEYDFFDPKRVQFLESCADLLLLAFAREDWYAPERIQLGLLPPAQTQQPLLSKFRSLVNARMQEAARAHEPLPILQAELQIWQQIEEELLGGTFTQKAEL